VFRVKVTGFIPGTTYNASEIFTLKIEGNYGPPRFLTEIRSLTVMVGQVGVLQFPSVTDPDSDKYHIDANRGLLTQCSSVSMTNIRFNPRSDSLAGGFIINITITDENKYVRFAVFQANVTVVEAPKKGPRQQVSPYIIQELKAAGKVKVIEVTFK
jgi:hypothetical protein